MKEPTLEPSVVLAQQLKIQTISGFIQNPSDKFLNTILYALVKLEKKLLTRF